MRPGHELPASKTTNIAVLQGQYMISLVMNVVEHPQLVASSCLSMLNATSFFSTRRQRAIKLTHDTCDKPLTLSPLLC
jgi:hypothetical protein